MEMFILVVALLAGLVIGSFLNVAVWRLPRGEMADRLRSHCPHCDAQIAWYDNLPIVSWILLRGRCRACRGPISARYPLVELLTGVLFLLAAREYVHVLPTGALVAAFLAALVAITFIDIDHRIIPDAITKPGMLVVLALAPLSALHPPDWIAGVKPALNAWLHAGTGILVGAGVVWCVRAVGSWVLKKEAMGLGDVKLLGLIGGVVGPLQVLYALALGCLGGALIGGIMFAIGKRRPVRCSLAVRGKGIEAAFDRIRVREDHLEIAGAPTAAVGTAVQLELTLPAAKILEEEDATLSLAGEITAAGRDVWRVRVLDAGEEDRERLEVFAYSYRYIPFGPFLALGGALTSLYGSHVHWILTEWYPRFTRSLLTGGG
jgi:leader peptidase (prepilin peptidase)/N-methyltransferase